MLTRERVPDLSRGLSSVSASCRMPVSPLHRKLPWQVAESMESSAWPAGC